MSSLELGWQRRAMRNNGSVLYSPYEIRFALQCALKVAFARARGLRELCDVCMPLETYCIQTLRNRATAVLLKRVQPVQPV